MLAKHARGAAILVASVSALALTPLCALAQTTEPRPVDQQQTGTPQAIQPSQDIPAETLPTASAPATGGRTAENAVTSAEDAFGTSVGRETIGLYNSTSVRGFSPTAAGNVRIEGLAFDQVWPLNSRLRRSTTIRVGISAQGYPFPAPTGIVDYVFRKPGATRSASVVIGGDSYGNAYAEVDAVIPLVEDRLSLGLGAAGFYNEYYNGTDAFYHQEAVSARWTPTTAIEIVPFWIRSDGYDDDAGPIFIPAGPYLPPTVERRRFVGPGWANYRGTAINYGSLATVRPAEAWTVHAGVFRSLFDDQTSFAHLLLDVTPDGAVGSRLIIADPPIKIASTSGEVRVTRALTEGPRLHLLHANVRARDRTRRYDGSDEIDFGPTRIGVTFRPPEPDFAFTEQTRDRIRQATVGLAYEGRWREVGELGLGLQKTDYRKRIELPGIAPTENRADPWLYSVTAAAYVNDRLAVYGGYTRGLEESGVAPSNAANRNEALPAIKTSQRDLGVRYALTPELKLVAGVFEVTKPYFNLDQADRFGLLGDVRNRGVELSVAGKLTSQLSVVAGAVLLDAEVTGEAAELGRVGPKPVGQTERTVELNLDWSPPALKDVSFDLSVSHRGDVTATRDNLVEIPARTLLDLGARYRFKLADRPATLRFAVTNLTDEQGFDLQGSGAYDIIPGRVASVYLATDF